MNPPTSRPANGTDEKLHATFEIGFDSIGNFVRKKPVHEDITIAAFILANPKVRFPKGTEYTNLDKKQWEYIRGLIWADDPSCLLFNDSSETNNYFGKGFDFSDAFRNGPPGCMTQRSHFNNLQFLHSMASNVGEAPEYTKASILEWIEVMYKLAIGNQGVSEHDNLGTKFPKRFSPSSEPRDTQTIRDLILGTTPSYRHTEISKRALGNCLHMIQDSYAVGHTLRALCNPGDLDSPEESSKFLQAPCLSNPSKLITYLAGFVRFKPGTYGRLGPILAFHTYPGQSKRHDHYDESHEKRTPKDLNTFNHIIGARDCIEKSKVLIDFFAAKTKWEDGVGQWLANDVFALHKDVQHSNNEVDEHFGASGFSVVDTVPEFDFRLGLERKMAALEGGLIYTPNQRVVVRARHVSLMIMGLKYIVAFIGVLVLFVLAQLMTKALGMS